MNNVKPFEIHVDLENFAKKHGFWKDKDITLSQQNNAVAESLQKKESIKMNYL